MVQPVHTCFKRKSSVNQYSAKEQIKLLQLVGRSYAEWEGVIDQVEETYP